MGKLTAILKQGESLTVEFKESFQEEALQTVAAFANTQGGVLLLGVNDAGMPTGLTVGKATLREIADRIAACTEPRVVPDIQVDTLRRHAIVVLQVPEYPIKPVAVRGRCYKRVGDSNRLLSPAAIAEIHMASTGTSWDARLLPDKTINIQIKVFDDHIRIWNPGLLPYGMTFEELHKRTHASKPRNKFIAQVFYDLGIIERYGSGIHRILDVCAVAGLPEPTFSESSGGLVVTFRKAVTATCRQQKGEKVESQSELPAQLATQSPTQSGDPVTRLLSVLQTGDLSSSELRTMLKIKHRPTFRKNYLHPALAADLIILTIPDKPNSRLQKYRLTAKGKAVLYHDKG